MEGLSGLCTSLPVSMSEVASILEINVRYTHLYPYTKGARLLMERKVAPQRKRSKAVDETCTFARLGPTGSNRERLSAVLRGLSSHERSA